MKGSSALLCSVVMALFGLVASVAQAAAPGTPEFDYEWIKGHPFVQSEQTAVLRITMGGDIDDPTSPGLTIAGFNFVMEIPEGVVDETTVSIPGGGDAYQNIVPMSPDDANAYGSPKVRLLTDYRTIVDAYPASLYPTAPDAGRDEQNAMLWDANSFIVEDFPGAPAGRKWITLTGVAQRLKNVPSLGNIPSMTNALTDVAITEPLGPAGSTAGTSQRAAFLDIEFLIPADPSSVGRADLFYNIQIFANPSASETMATEDSLPSPFLTEPLDPQVFAVDTTAGTGSFAETDGLAGGSQPQILEPAPAQTLENESWDVYE